MNCFLGKTSEGLALKFFPNRPKAKLERLRHHLLIYSVPDEVADFTPAPLNFSFSFQGSNSQTRRSQGLPRTAPLKNGHYCPYKTFSSKIVG